MVAPADPSRFIAENLPLRPVPFLPGVALHTPVPQSGVWRLASDGTPPYWAWPWAGGLALAQHVTAHPELVKGRSVIDLGTGSGLVAIAAALAGAETVTAVDIDPLAIAAATLNARHNGARIALHREDLLDGPPPLCDSVLVGDLFYDAALATRLALFLDRCLAAGIGVYVGDIGRAHLPRHRLQALGHWPVAEFGTSAPTPRKACAYRFVSAPSAGEPKI